MKNNKWSVRSQDNRPVHVVLLVSRNKDNKDVEGFKERRLSFVTKEDRETLFVKYFEAFRDQGVNGEMSRMYISVNARDEDKIQKELIHFLIDTPNFNLCSIDAKMAGIAAKHENRAESKWMFDFDIEDGYYAALEFVEDIKKIDSTVEVEINKTPHGYAIIASHGFDTRSLLEKWNDEVTLKRDDLLCVDWGKNI